MRSFSATAAVLALQASSALAAVVPKPVTHFACGSEHPPAHIIDAAATMADAGTDAGRFNFNLITVRTYVHVVTTEASKGKYTQAMISEQVCGVITTDYVILIGGRG